MKASVILLMIVLITLSMKAQNSDSTTNIYSSTSELLVNGKSGISLGGYGEIHYNQSMVKEQYSLGTIDAHRLILFLGYNFSKKTQFVSEIEFEHANELWVEQMFLQHKLNNYINLRLGMMLVPMGIINEYHEPTTFNGVERPVIDNKISPSTWREIGIGFQGNIIQAKTRYQIYLVNGINGYDGTQAMLSGSKGIRNGRQKGSNAYINKPALTGRLEFYAVKNLNAGISGYFGESNSRLYSKISRNDVAMVEKADSSVVGISMIGVDARYNLSGFKFTSQLYYVSFSNTEQYNLFTAKNGISNDLGKSMIGYYVEIGYNVFKPFESIKTSLTPFIRYEAYDTHLKVENPIAKNLDYNNKIITTGLTYAISKGSVLKADLQFSKSGTDEKYSTTLNAGFGIMF